MNLGRFHKENFGDIFNNRKIFLKNVKVLEDVFEADIKC